MSGFKVPRYVRTVTEWPMSATKVQKFRLRDLLVGELAADQSHRGSSGTATFSAMPQPRNP